MRCLIVSNNYNNYTFNFVQHRAENPFDVHRISIYSTWGCNIYLVLLHKFFIARGGLLVLGETLLGSFTMIRGERTQIYVKFFF